MKTITGGICAAKGYKAAGIHCGIRKNKSKKDLSLIISEKPASAAAVYTTNLVKGAPLLVTKKHISNGVAQAIICNSGNANTCNSNGIEIAEQTCELVAEALQMDKTDILVASTGVIGQPLDIAPIKAAIPSLVASLGDNSDAAAEGIMTTDTRKKEIAEDFLRFVFENTTMKVLLVPHVVEENNNDYDFMKPIFEKFEHTGRIAILPPDLEARQYKGYIAGTRFFVGARTHSTIAAYSSGVPTIALGYSVKARGIAKDIFGEEKYVLDIKAMTDYEELRDEFLKLLENENEIRRELMKSIPLRMRSAMEAGEMLQKI